jgi:hypothetical protein
VIVALGGAGSVRLWTAKTCDFQNDPGKQGCAWAAVGAADVSTMIPRAKSKVFVKASALSDTGATMTLRKRP